MAVVYAVPSGPTSGQTSFVSILVGPLLAPAPPITVAVPTAVMRLAGIAPTIVLPIVQEGFRWRNDDGSETGATWMAAQDTNATLALATNARLRVLVDNPDPALYTLYYKKTSDSTWLPVEVGSAGGDPVYVATSSNITAGGEDTSAQLTAPAGKTTGDFAIGRMWDDENGEDLVPVGITFVEPFDDLDAWTDARTRSEVSIAPEPLGYVQNFGPSSLDNVVPPDDVAIFSGQVWLGVGPQDYGDTTIRCNRPFDFTDGGTIELDVWVPPFGENLRGWPHLTVTSEPMACPSAKSDNSGGPTARYGFEIRFNYGRCIFSSTYYPAPWTIVWDDYVETPSGIDVGTIGVPIVSTSTVMTHVVIEFTPSHIDISADGDPWFSNDWTLPPELTTGWLYLAGHNHASIKYAYGPNTWAVYDNLTVTNALSPRRCWKVDNVAALTVDGGEFDTDGVSIGWHLPATVTVPDVPAGVTSARLLCTTHADGIHVTGSSQLTFSLNGNTAHSQGYPEWNGTALGPVGGPVGNGSAAWSIELDVDELVTGDNDIDFSHSTISGIVPYVSNVQILTEGGS